MYTLVTGLLRVTFPQASISALPAALSVVLDVPVSSIVVKEWSVTSALRRRVLQDRCAISASYLKRMRRPTATPCDSLPVVFDV